MPKKKHDIVTEGEAVEQPVAPETAVVALPPAPKLLRVRAISYFLDGNVYPRALKEGDVIEVTKEQYQQLRASAPRNWELVSEKEG